MCGRYVVARATSDLVALFDIEQASDELPAPDWNVAPTKLAPIVVEPPPRGDAMPIRRLEAATWGLVPGWAKDPSVGVRAFNARSETAAEKPTFRAAVASRRALVPADGWYEWRKDGEAKTPLFIHGDDTIAFAGLYEWWKRPDGTWLLSSTILTAAATGSLRDVHERMPVVLPREAWDTWLDPESEGDQSFVDAAVEAARAGVDALSMHEVGRAVGNVRENGPQLVQPVSHD